jgi:hypothetical protein
MFDSLKSMGAVANLLKNKDQIAAAGQRVQERMEALRVTGESGGGAVRAIVTGKMRVESIHIEPAAAQGFAADEDSRLMAQALITHAVNDGLIKAQEAAQAAIATEAEALGVPEIADKLQGGLGGLLT